MLGDGVLKSVACRVTIDGTVVEGSPVEAGVFCVCSTFLLFIRILIILIIPFGLARLLESGICTGSEEHSEYGLMIRHSSRSSRGSRAFTSSREH